MSTVKLELPEGQSSFQYIQGTILNEKLYSNSKQYDAYS